MPTDAAVAVARAPAAVRLSVQAFRGTAGEVAARLAAASGADVLPVAPGRWTVVLPGGASATAAGSLKEALKGLAAVVDVTDGYAAVVLTGPDVDRRLETLIAIDPPSIAPGKLVRTSLHGLAVEVRRLPDGAIEIAAPSSYADDLFHRTGFAG